MDVNCDENTFLTTVFCGRLLVALKKAIYMGYLLALQKTFLNSFVVDVL